MGRIALQHPGPVTSPLLAAVIVHLCELLRPENVKLLVHTGLNRVGQRRSKIIGGPCDDGIGPHGLPRIPGLQDIGAR